MSSSEVSSSSLDNELQAQNFQSHCTNQIIGNEFYTENLEQIVKKQRKLLKETERLAAIGQTAGMVGHDIRNPLQAIVSELYLAKEECENIPNDTTKKAMLDSFEFIEEQLNYINKIVSDLQDYARPLNPELKPVNVDEAVLSSLSTLTVPENIQVKVFVNMKQTPVKLDLLMLKRILINLITNSIQAMPNGGKLTLKTNIEAGNAVIKIEDTGVGIPNQIKTKIFKPLMTTKSKGQGFGLAVARRLVDVQGGRVSFESEVDKGTVFTLEFPLSDTSRIKTLLDYL
jgi:signal transduction histidine kinase